jgi:hypothetical protein
VLRSSKDDSPVLESGCDSCRVAENNKLEASRFRDENCMFLPDSAFVKIPIGLERKPQQAMAFCAAKYCQD